MAQQNNGIDETDKKFIKFILICLALLIIVPVVGLLILSLLNNIQHRRAVKYQTEASDSFVQQHKNELTKVSVDCIEHLYSCAEQYNVPVEGLCFVLDQLPEYDEDLGQNVYKLHFDLDRTIYEPEYERIDLATNLSASDDDTEIYNNFSDIIKGSAEYSDGLYTPDNTRIIASCENWEETDYFYIRFFGYDFSHCINYEINVADYQAGNTEAGEIYGSAFIPDHGIIGE